MGATAASTAGAMASLTTLASSQTVLELLQRIAGPWCLAPPSLMVLNNPYNIVQK